VKLAALLLGLLGLAQMAGDLTGVRALAGLAGATAASPAPRVFSAVRGLETFTSGFALEIRETDGSMQRVELTPALNARIRGPYNRRNVYGAALAYGPVLAADPRTRALFDAISRAALCGNAPLLDELGLLTGKVAAVSVEVAPRAGVAAPDLPLQWTIACR
jgi:hypothetical protein